jgi:transcriptional regulator with PAS, ATPase and Fis domain/tetratricopeptide (TPR) repeat protein
METSTSARQLLAAGRFIEALRLLDDRSTISRARTDDVLRVEVLERIGRHLQCRALAERLLNTKELNHADRSICEFSRGLVELNAGNIETAIAHLQTSVSAALLAQDLERLCWPQLRLLVTLGDYSGPDASRPLIAVLRSNATKLGNPAVTAALHIFVGEMEAKRGLLKSAERHTSLGLQILSSVQNLWLESIAHNTSAAVAIMLSEVERGFSRGRRALHLAQESGAVAMQRACLGNLGNLYFAIGAFDKAVEHFEMANAVLQSRGDNYNAGVDGIARVRLSQGNLEECGRLLDQIDESIRTPKDHVLYGHRYSKLTRTQLLAREGRLLDALGTVEGVIRLAADSGDHLLNQMALLTKAELLQQVGNVSEAMKTLDTLADTLAQQPPEHFAHYDRILACTLAARGDIETATLHFDRARRTYESIRSTPGLVELSRRWRDTTTTHQDTAAPKPDAAPTAAAARNVLQSVAFLLRHHGRPELVARELVYLIGETASTLSARAVSVGEGPTEVLASAHTSAKTNDGENVEQRLPIGFARDRSVELELQVKPDPASRATVHATKLLLSTIRDLERARAEREERMSLWPAEDDLAETGNAIAKGHMQEVMSFAKKIANSNITVFITGESGTGKEIVARAIHQFSERAGKPFVPFNCTAVPREMLESQLFGHRRGSFTGADRDHPGMIGAARDGTLFLDEIGELGLDMQPKLLRFLESNEVCPIGEVTPFQVDVRVVAATNSNVEQLVEDGRFRSDLFYRLNILRLTLKPLRERRDEIPALVQFFLTHFAAEHKRGDVRVSEDTMEHLILCKWPGNVRQLQNEMRRVVALAEPNAIIMPEALSEGVFNTRLAQRPAVRPDFEMVVSLKDTLPSAVAKVEREMIQRALRDHHGSLDDAARTLGISRKGLYLKRQRLGL